MEIPPQGRGIVCEGSKKHIGLFTHQMMRDISQNRGRNSPRNRNGSIFKTSGRGWPGSSSERNKIEVGSNPPAADTPSRFESPAGAFLSS